MISAGEVHYAGPTARHRRAEGPRDHRPAKFFGLPPSGREGSCRRAGHRARHGRGGFRGAGRSRREAARRGRSRLGEGRPRQRGRWWPGRANTASEHHPYRRTVDSRLWADRQGRRARRRRGHHRPHQRRANGAAGSTRSSASAKVAVAGWRSFTTATSAPRCCAAHGQGARSAGARDPRHRRAGRIRRAAARHPPHDLDAVIAGRRAGGDRLLLRHRQHGAHARPRLRDHRGGPRGGFRASWTSRSIPRAAICSTASGSATFLAIGMTVIDGVVRTQRSRNTPPASTMPGTV